MNVYLLHYVDSLSCCHEEITIGVYTSLSNAVEAWDRFKVQNEVAENYYSAHVEIVAVDTPAKDDGDNTIYEIPANSR
jgi:hypothetical protein